MCACVCAVCACECACVCAVCACVCASVRTNAGYEGGMQFMRVMRVMGVIQPPAEEELVGPCTAHTVAAGA